MKRLCLICLLMGTTVLAAAPARADQVPAAQSLTGTGVIAGQGFFFAEHEPGFNTARSLTFMTSMIDCNVPHFMCRQPEGLFSVEFTAQGIGTTELDRAASAPRSVFSLGSLTSNLINIPEPATITLLSLGLGLIGAKLSRTRRKS